ncbi:FHA domain-containing protein [Desulfogranum japonicum]|uniref:FHA domain-containing protein n=1 Tax=Desulfogranum japonicum TaxID=231447 RepID=UPI00041B57ED|nr:FHA domain-containing protein [Desulfogranum japonicum]
MQLSIHLKGQQVQSLQLRPGTYSLGRSPENDICLPDPSISRLHATFEVSETGTITLFDQNSTNGIWAGKKKVVEYTWDDDKTIIIIGNYQLKQHLPAPKTQQPAKTAQTPPPAAPPRTTVRQPPTRRIEQPYSVTRSSAFEPVSTQPHYQPYPDEQEQEETTKKKEGRSFLEPLLTVMVAVLVVPFIVFAAQNLFHNDPIIAEVEQREQQKSKELQANKEQITLSLELNKVTDLIKHNNFNPALELLREILDKYPGNTKALALQESIYTAAAEQKAEKEEKERERRRLQKEQELQQKRQIIAQLKTQLEKQIATRDYAACLETAKRLNTFEPANTIAVQGLSVCSERLLEARTAAAQQPAAEQEEEKPKEVIALEKILAQGKELLQQQKTTSALKTWAKANKIDPDAKFTITRTINAERKALINKINRNIRGQIEKGQNARKANKPLEALKYFRTAYKLSPSNKKIKALIIEQIQMNSQEATALYQEAIAYASLGSTAEAVNLLNKAIRLSDGNKKLREKFNKKLAELQ